MVDVNLDKIQQITEESKHKGIHVFWVIPPRLVEYSEILPIADQLPPEHVIDVSDFNEYSEFYNIDYSHDRGHLNKKGAILFSEIVAQKSLELIR